MTADQVLTEWGKNVFKPVYWLEGEEEFFIDKVVNYAEEKLLSEAEASFNLTIFYGKDAAWADVINSCRRYPMFSERQVVILKEAQQMRDLDKLEAYINNPLASTILIVAHKHKKVDGRTALAKMLKSKTVFLQSAKLRDNQLPEWTQELLASKGLNISPKGLVLILEHIGNDLSRIQNEVDKLAINLGKRKTITEDDIESFIGISKEFNVFELQAALARKDLAKSIRIIKYFESNPKAAPIQLILPSLYAFFSKAYMTFSVNSKSEKEIALALGIPPFFARDYIQAAGSFGFTGIEKILLLLHQYNLRNIGINDSGTEDASLLKELAVKIIT